MGPFDIAVIVIISVAFCAVAGCAVWRKVKRKGGCDCSSCGCCPGCAACKKRDGQKD